MISVKEAFSTILDRVAALPSVTCALEQAAGRTLRQQVVADRDLPPYDRVMMDGIAASSEAFSGEGTVRLRVLGQQLAGAPPQKLPDVSGCLEVATGAVRPEGADLIIPVEEIQLTDGVVEVAASFEPVPGRYVHREGSDCKAGHILLVEGDVLGAKEIAVAASCGAAEVQVSALPQVAIVSTGDELVDVAETPLPHQIRRSNSHSLAAALQISGLGTSQLVHFPDDPDAVRSGLSEILPTSDTVILSGGVSKGRKDYLPQALAELGVEKVFHWVAQRPGKPFWFGIGPGGQPVFALPGNPLSALTCFHRYVAPALRKMAGQVLREPLMHVLGQGFTFKPPLTCFLPVRLENGNATVQAIPDPAGNSGDFAGILGTDGFVELSREPSVFSAGESVPFWPWIME